MAVSVRREKIAQNLVGISSRLQAMSTDYAQASQQRNFQVFGIEVITVEYSHIDALIKVLNNISNEIYWFDDFDLAAIEVFEQLQDFKMRF